MLPVGTYVAVTAYGLPGRRPSLVGCLGRVVGHCSGHNRVYIPTPPSGLASECFMRDDELKVRPTFYIAGPMRGCKDFNFPAFDAARDLGHSLFYNIVSPADLDRTGAKPEGAVFDNDTGYFDGDSLLFIKRDLDVILHQLDPARGDGLCLLPGWEGSVGAMGEVSIAQWRGGFRFVNQDFQDIYLPWPPQTVRAFLDDLEGKGTFAKTPDTPVARLGRTIGAIFFGDVAKRLSDDSLKGWQDYFSGVFGLPADVPEPAKAPAGGGHPRFYELLKQMADLHAHKNHDYAGNEDPLANFRMCEAQGLQPWQGIVVRLGDKFSRLQTFARQGTLAVKSESITDTLMDLAVYSLLAILCYEDSQHKEASKVERGRTINDETSGAKDLYKPVADELRAMQCHKPEGDK